MPPRLPPDAASLRHKLQVLDHANTTIAVVATDARLTKPQTNRLAVAAHDGFARAIWPAHTAFDGDTVFSLATAQRDDRTDSVELGAAAAAVTARAIARAIHLADPQPGDGPPAWRERFG